MVNGAMRGRGHHNSGYIESSMKIQICWNDSGAVLESSMGISLGVM
jgi:hypothetical protein